MELEGKGRPRGWLNGALGPGTVAPSPVFVLLTAQKVGEKVMNQGKNLLIIL